ncbi:predicted protein [Naegleria gruberi]|uniref:Predicted protein n=1 Tax=Naegleria gruberi TaxID=5762 RepID=D2VXD6_NAEGR|nr:uncharacterized protein NAEGRDRAFT_73708 [Naegleria gruberi]EFC38489.1 predicted protein [Naegleria gruberi]|eukprot:XP_002671233.1 predicted protein [Naegleria gruberi strain NEG-M]
MSTLTYSPSLGFGTTTKLVPTSKNYSIDNPLILVVKVRSQQPNPGKLAPVFGPLGISPKVISQRITELVQALNWSAKHITVRFIVKSRDMIDLELAEHSPLFVISNLGEAPSDKQYHVVHDGNLTFDQLIHIAQTKKSSKTARTLTAKVKEVLGTCVSIGCKVNGEDPRVVLLQINNGTSPFKIPEPKE